MHKRALVVALLATLVLSACATAGSVYRPATVKGGVGYTEQEVTPTSYRVTFTAPKEAGTQAAQDYALLRAAELTLAKGHTWFQLASRTVAEVQVDRPKVVTGGTTAQNYSCASPGGAGMGAQGCSFTPAPNSIAGVNVGVGGTYDTRIVANIDFVMGDGALPSSPQAYDAKSTADRLRASLAVQ